MRAFRIAECSGPSGLVRSEETRPTPGAKEVLIRIRASSINFRDLMILGSGHGMKLSSGLIPLSDGAGEVVSLGDRVTRFREGDRVMPIFNQHWIAGDRPINSSALGLGGDGDGTLRDYMVVDQEGLVRIPDHLSFEEAACLPCAGLTAWSAVVEKGAVYPGDVVLTQGSGGVSIFALQFAKLFGARVISTSSSDEKCSRLRYLGANDTSNYVEFPAWDEEVRRLTGGRGADRVVEVGGAGTLARSFRSVHANARIAIVGLLAGAKGGEGFDYVGWVAETFRTAVGSRESFERMNRAICWHKLRPVIDRVFAFDNAPAAFGYLQEKKHFGKVVISHA